MPSTFRSPGGLLPIPGGTDSANVAALLEALRLRLAERAADASPPAVLVPHDPSVAADDVAEELRQRAHGAPPAGTTAILRTSGSTTGHGHLITLTASALIAGARAGEKALGGPGRWVLALPAHHIAGFQILVRSVVSGTEPVLVDTSAGFDPLRLAEAVTRAAETDRAYVSLVPTQLHRVLESGPGVLEAMRTASAILVGGAATAPSLQDAARSVGLPIVTSYGMTETSGGCVYDGRPLEGVQLRIATERPGAGRVEAPGPGRVEIAGPMLAAGYLDQQPGPFTTDADGKRWLQTSDLGELHGGRLQILGRADDVINTGGVKVAPGPVEDVLTAMGSIAAAVVVGVPDEQWGQIVVAVVVPAAPGRPLELAELRETVRRTLGAAHAPRAVVTTSELAMLGPGKMDRRAATRLAIEMTREDAHGHGQ